MPETGNKLADTKGVSSEARDIVLAFRRGQITLNEELDTLIVHLRVRIIAYLNAEFDFEYFMDAEDVFQKVMLRFASAQDQYDPSLPLVPWIVGMARHIALDHVRRDTERRSKLLRWRLPEHVESDGGVEAKKIEQATELERCLRFLEPSERKLVILKCVERLTLDEIATELGYPASTISDRFQRVIKKLNSYTRSVSK